MLARWLGRLSCFVDFPYRDHRLRARRRCLAISNARRQTLRIGPYRDLLKVTGKMAGYARAALVACEDSSHLRVVRVRSLLEHYLELTDRVIDQTERRVLRGESVPAGQKVVSIFEEHTDLIRKGGRETVYGHKVFLSCGKSSLILDCLPVRGNPSDSTYLETMLDRHCHQYGFYPRQASLDGGFASKGNLALAKSKPGLKDVAFAKFGYVTGVHDQSAAPSDLLPIKGRVIRHDHRTVCPLQRGCEVGLAKQLEAIEVEDPLPGRESIPIIRPWRYS